MTATRSTLWVAGVAAFLAWARFLFVKSGFDPWVSIVAVGTTFLVFCGLAVVGRVHRPDGTPAPRVVGEPHPGGPGEGRDP